MKRNIIIAILILLTLLAGYWVNYKIKDNQDLEDLEMISISLGVNPTRDDVIHEIDCEVLAYGKSKEEIFIDLNKTQPY